MLRIISIFFLFQYWLRQFSLFFQRCCMGEDVILDGTSIPKKKLKIKNPIIYLLKQALNSLSGMDAKASIAHDIHEFSTSSANSQLLTALLHGRDVILDGTLTWMEYVRQTVAMVRNIHRMPYRQGPGYSKLPNGTTIERYVVSCCFDLFSPLLSFVFFGLIIISFLFFL